MEDGTKLYAKHIISNADPGITYHSLVGKENISDKLSKKLNKAKYSCTSLMLFLTVDMDVKAAGLDSGNIWMLDEGDMNANFQSMQQEDILKGDTFKGMFISCTTLKDPPSFDGKHHTIEAITFINYDSFKKYKNEDVERSKEYLDFKEQVTEKMARTLEKALPNVR